MNYIVIYTDKKGSLYKKTAKDLVEAQTIRRKILDELITSSIPETVENLKKNFDVEIKTKEDFELIFKDLYECFKDYVSIITEEQWSDFLRDKKIVRVSEMGMFVVLKNDIDFSDPEQYANILKKIKGEKTNDTKRAD